MQQDRVAQPVLWHKRASSPCREANALQQVSQSRGKRCTRSVAVAVAVARERLQQAHRSLARGRRPSPPGRTFGSHACAVIHATCWPRVPSVAVRTAGPMRACGAASAVKPRPAVSGCGHWPSATVQEGQTRGRTGIRRSSAGGRCACDVAVSMSLRPAGGWPHACSVDTRVRLSLRKHGGWVGGRAHRVQSQPHPGKWHPACLLTSAETPRTCTRHHRGVAGLSRPIISRRCRPPLLS